MLELKLHHLAYCVFFLSITVNALGRPYAKIFVAVCTLKIVYRHLNVISIYSFFLGGDYKQQHFWSTV